MNAICLKGRIELPLGDSRDTLFDVHIFADEPMLAMLADKANHADRTQQARVIPTQGPSGSLLGKAQNLYEARRRRDALFERTNIFGEPAWDMLLDLFIKGNQRMLITTTTACSGSCAPPSTGLRTIGVLINAGLVERSENPDDRRHSLIYLSTKGQRLMTDYLMTA